MKRLVLTGLIALALAGCSALRGGRPASALVEDCAERTRPVDRAQIGMAIERGGSEEQAAQMALTLWMHAAAGRYRAKVEITAATGAASELVGTELHLILGPDGAVTWRVREEEVLTASRDADQRTTPGEPTLLKDLGPLVLFADAAFGYPHLLGETRLVRSEPPLAGDDELLWVQVRKRPGTPERFVELLALIKAPATIWLGLSPATGWPMRHVVRGESIDFVSRVKRIDLTPRLGGVFDVPDDVQAKLEGSASGEGDE